MIKFGDFSEIPNNTEEPFEKYKDIKPNISMSEKTVNDFWLKEFSENNEDEANIKDLLLAEIYNQSEDELQIDFVVDDSLKEKLEIFQPENWSGLSETEQCEAIDNLINEIGNRLELDTIPEVRWLEEDGEYGSFDALENIINLNPKYQTDSVELVDTIAHELRHAYQYMRAERMETRQDALFKYNFDNYISPVPLPGGGCLFFMDYLGQYVEVDARVFANKFTEAML